MLSQLQRWMFKQDDDCHWYMIKEEDEDDFHSWVYGEDSLDSYEHCRIDSPEHYTFENPE